MVDDIGQGDLHGRKKVFKLQNHESIRRKLKCREGKRRTEVEGATTCSLWGPPWFVAATTGSRGGGCPGSLFVPLCCFILASS